MGDYYDGYYDGDKKESLWKRRIQSDNAKLRRDINRLERQK